MTGPSRRELLGGLGALAAGAALAPVDALAFGAATRVDIAELDLGAGTLARPNAWKRLLYAATLSTSVACEPRVVRVSPEGAELFEHPFAVLVGDGAFAAPSDAAVEQLVQYLQYGGFLFVDDASGEPDGPFDRSVRALCQRLFPTRPLAPLPADHPAMRSFFLLQRVPGRVDRVGWLEGVTVATQVPLLYSRNDVSGALDQAADGRYVHACVPNGETQRREAVKVGINALMYALTSNYKSDQAHVRQLLIERRIP